MQSSVRVINPVFVEAAGNKPKQIAEHIGRVASGDAQVSIAKMNSPEGWIEPPQTPAFDEYTLVLRGELHVTTAGGTEVVRAGQALCVPRGTRAQYSTPSRDGAEYVAVCCPAFGPELSHRE
ncbi:MAG TPA: cupin domain-containing protein [Polyangiaceae bacterium]